ncbi:MAG: helicase-exonuclease AddAB subunit AddA [Lachnospiraceae bacterium]|nr:helicase-exonuclease AddAB subunit AddA [Lachnospiraceae bacterium]
MSKPAFKPTPDQEKAINTRKCDLLVAAAAGSGKTAVLVQRILSSIINDGADIDHYLIVTFTNTAASEMKEKIITAIDEAVEKDPENDHLARQLILVRNANISTIDGFCLKVLRENFQLAGVDPGFRIGEPTEIALLEADVLDDCFKKWHKEGREDFLALCSAFSKTESDENVKKLITNLTLKAGSEPWPYAWLEEVSAKQELTDKIENMPIFKEIMRKAGEKLEEIRNTFIGLKDLADKYDCLYSETFEADIKLINGIMEEGKKGYFSLGLALHPKFVPIKRIKAEEKTDFTEGLADLRGKLKKKLKKICTDYFSYTEDELKHVIKMENGYVKTLCDLTKEYMDCLLAAKKEKNILHFNDIAHYTLNILLNEDGTRTEVAKEMAKKFDEIMIDEYQDSNYLQEYILTAVSGGKDGTKNIFMVGDIKQSIYKFRMANPDLFKNKYSLFNYDEGNQRKIDLKMNFRSRREVLDATNIIFAKIMDEDITEIGYEENAMLNVGREQIVDNKNHNTEFLFITRNAEEGNDEGDEGDDVKERVPDASAETAEEDETGDGESKAEEDKIKAEAIGVSKRIEELVHNEGWKYGDIVILLRSAKGWFEPFLSVFEEFNIPAYAETETGYFSAVEVIKVLDYLKVLDNPYQDIAFTSVLHSPFADLSAGELALLGTLRKKEGKKERIYTLAREMAKEGNEKLTAFFNIYDVLRKKATLKNVHELLADIYEETGYLKKVYAMPGGERRRGNLNMLVSIALKFEKTSFGGLTDFVRYIKKLRTYEQDFGEAKSSEGGNFVRLMTIHKSKGLEFPVVFVCGMNKEINRMDIHSSTVIHEKYGIGMKVTDPETRIVYSSLTKRYIAEEMNKEVVSEELRVLYVALTRAREKLILTGFLGQTEKDGEVVTDGDKWAADLPTPLLEGLRIKSDILSKNSYFSMVCPYIFDDERSFSSYMGSSKVISADIGSTHVATTLEFRLTDASVLSAKAARKPIEEELNKKLEELKEKDFGKGSFAEELTKKLEEMKNYSYPYAVEAALPVKMTVSEIKKMAMEENEEAETAVIPESPEKAPHFEGAVASMYANPEGSSEGKLSGAEKGTLFHHLMELLPFEKDYTGETLKEELDGFVKNGLVKKEELAQIDTGKILTFFNSSLGKMMRNAAKAGKLYKEQSFMIRIPAGDIFKDIKTSETIIVQGIIDAYFVLDGKLIIMDYKTDYIREDATRELSEKYKKQLELYGFALSKLTGMEVSKMYFYSVSKDLEVSV